MRDALADIRPDLVLHLAAATDVDGCERDPGVAWAVNDAGTGQVAEAAAAVGAHLVYLSTDYVYDGTLDRPYRGDDPVAPLSVYGASKLAGEARVGDAATIVRTSWVSSTDGGVVGTALRPWGPRIGSARCGAAEGTRWSEARTPQGAEGDHMRIVVTGAAGFIGSHLVDALLADDHDVVGIDCFTDYYPRADKVANLAAASTHERFTLHEVDLRVDLLEPHIAGADVVVNQAATPGLVLSWDDFDAYQSCNLTAAKRLVDACLATGVGHLVQASTSSIYGAEATGREGASTRPVSPYGVTKLAAEHLLRAHSEAHRLPLTILRYFSIYGPRQRPDMAYRIFCERLLRGTPITIYGDGHQSRSNTYVDDCVVATVLAATRAGQGDVLNVGGGAEVELLDALAILADILEVAPVVHHEPARSGDQRRTVADIGRAQEVLGWSPQVVPEVGLRLEAEWVRHRMDATEPETGA